MGESKIVRNESAVLSDRARNERIARMGSGRGSREERTLPPEHIVDRGVDLSGKKRTQTVRITDNVYIVVNQPIRSQNENTRRDYRVDIVNGGTTRLSNGEYRGNGGGGTWIDVAVDGRHSERDAKAQIKKGVNEFIERVRKG